MSQELNNLVKKTEASKVFSWLRSTFDQYRTIIKNSLFLSFVNSVRLLLPFIAMPYIIRICGTENFGRIIFAQAVIGYFSILVSFGLDIITVREVANNLDKPQMLSRLASTFITLRLLLFLLSSVILFLLLLFVPFFQQSRLLLLFSFTATLAEALTMTAFFQGMEKMHNIAALQLFSIVFYLGTLFIFVRSKESYELIPLLQSLGLLIAAVLGVALLRFKYKIKFVCPLFSEIRKLFKSSLPFAMSRIAIIINTNTAKFFIGLALGMHELAVLDMVQKVSSAAMLPASIIDQAIYPHNAKHKDRHFATKTFFYMLLLGVVCAGLMALGTSSAVQFFGQGKLNDAIPLLYIMCLNVIMTTITFYAGSPVLVAFGYVKPYNMSIVWTSFLTIVIYPAMYFSGMLSLYMVIAIMIFNEIFIASYRMFYCVKHKLLFCNTKGIDHAANCSN